MLRAQGFGPVTRIDMTAGPAEGLRWSACYLVDGILFDAAMHHGRVELAAFLDGRAKTVALTHCHEDHSGGASALAGESRVLAPAGHLGLLAEPEHLNVARETVWGTPEPVTGEPLPDELIEAGRRYAVIPMPGHCPEHVAFENTEEGWVFGGDLVTATGPRFARGEEDLIDLVASLRAVIAMQPARVFLAHVAVAESALAPLTALLTYLEDHAARVRDLADRGVEVAEIVERVFGGEHRRKVWGRQEMTVKEVSGGDFSTENLVRKLLALAEN